MKTDCGHLETRSPGTVALLGVPSDEGSSFLRGAAAAPSAIRRALHSGSSNLCSETGVDFGTEPLFRDCGDLDLPSGALLPEEIEAGVSSLLDRGARVLSLGGDHAITYPILRAYARRHPDLTILQLDAHPDLYDELDGNRFSHACAFARIMEDGLATRLVQVGIRTLNPHQRTQAERFGVEIHEVRHRHRGTTLTGPLVGAGPLYLSLDLDVLDPAFAPGVSHHEPGGLTVRDVIDVIQGLTGSLVGADLVEYNPTRDLNGVTAMVAAKLLKEIAARMLETAPPPATTAEASRR